MRQEFDLDPGLIYLNSGTHSICPRSVLEAVWKHHREYERNPTAGLFGIWDKLWKVQQELAAFYRGEAKDFFFRHNVTAVMNAMVLGLEMPKGSEILLTNLEYGAITNLCKFRAEQDGLKLRTFTLPMTRKELVGIDRHKLAAMVISQLRPETRLLVASHVIMGTGLVLPIDEIAKECRKRDILFMVDGAHAPGALPIDFSKLSQLDFYATTLHKWMLGPKGTAWGWVHPDRQALIRPTTAGWTTFESNEPFHVFGNGSRFQGAFLMSACHDFAPFLAIHEMIEFWNKHGQEKIRARLRELQSQLETEMGQTQWTPLSPPADMRGPLLTFDIPDSLQSLGRELMYRIYRENKLQVAVAPINGRWILRLSPHIYNTEEEISRAVGILRGYS